MKQEVIQDFLNLPGIAGVALIDRRSRPYFCGVDQTLNSQQKEALAEGILRVVETIPDGFETFEFQFTGYQVYIYKLDHGVVLLALTRSGLVYADYLETIKDLKVILNEDLANAIATFRLTAGNATLSGKRNTGTGSGDRAGFQPTASPGSSCSPLPSTSPPSPSNTIPNPSVSLSPPPSSGLPVGDGSTTVRELITALDALSRFTTEYLGTTVIVNYWKSTRPDREWLSHFQVDRSAKFTLSGTIQPQQPLGQNEQAWVQEWVAAFVKRCSLVIRDFPSLVEQKALEQNQKRLLLGR
jgi:hypothetical protein